MKRPLRVVLSVCLICNALALGQNKTFPTERTQNSPASDSKTPEPKQPLATNAHLGGIDVLSDTTGADIGSYLQSAVKIVKQNWYKFSPPSARAPKMMRGDVTIAFAILKTGKVVGMKLVENSSDVSLDRAAWAAIIYSKWSPLPAEYSGQSLALRFHFVYNPGKSSDAVLQYREGMRP